MRMQRCVGGSAIQSQWESVKYGCLGQKHAYIILGSSQQTLRAVNRHSDLVQVKAVCFILRAEELPNEWPLNTADTSVLARDITTVFMLCFVFR